MTREEAIDILYLLINSAIIEIDIEKYLIEIAECIKKNSFED